MKKQCFSSYSTGTMRHADNGYQHLMFPVSSLISLANVDGTLVTRTVVICLICKIGFVISLSVEAGTKRGKKMDTACGVSLRCVPHS